MSLRALAYISTAHPDLTLSQLDDLVASAARFNLQAGVTGLLLHDGTRFLQFIEGPEDGLSVAYSRIVAAHSHRDVLLLGRETTSGRFFPYWSMALLPAEPSELSRLAQADWNHFALRQGAMFELTRVVIPHLPDRTGPL